MVLVKQGTEELKKLEENILDKSNRKVLKIIISSCFIILLVQPRE